MPTRRWIPERPPYASVWFITMGTVKRTHGHRLGSTRALSSLAVICVRRVSVLPRTD